MENYIFAGYDLSGTEDDGYTIFMFVDPDDHEKGFTLSLRDHNGFNDHNALQFEGTEVLPENLKANIIRQLSKAVSKHSQEPDVCETLNRCLSRVRV
ncbi:MAG: hypothetical protein V2I33_14535 [Kangiellaceae bacterium]|jgi:hypothetical protein|nr:hypothetical protein [Kangiellaceae bacterium]